METMETVSIVDAIVANKNASDEILSNLAKRAVKNNDEQLLMKLATHPGAGILTLSIIAEK